MKKTKLNGILGRRVKLQPDKLETFMGEGEFLPQGIVLEAGPEANCKKGDHIRYISAFVDELKLGEESHYYIIGTDQFIVEVI